MPNCLIEKYFLSGFENVQDEDDDSIFNMEKKLSGIKMILPIGRL